MREFPTLGVVSSATGILVSDIGEVYDVLGYVLNDKLFTHQLPNASRAAEASLHEQHPWLADLEPPQNDLGALGAWCDAVIAEHGATIPLKPAEDADWVSGNALADLADVAAGRPVIVVQASPQSGATE